MKNRFCDMEKKKIIIISICPCAKSIRIGRLDPETHLAICKKKKKKEQTYGLCQYVNPLAKTDKTGEKDNKYNLSY